MSRRIELPCEELKQRYTVQGQTAHEIAASNGCSASTVIRRLHECAITVRSSRYIARQIPEELLRRLYLVERLPQNEIARQLGISPGTLASRLRLYGIPQRPPIINKLLLRQLWAHGLSIDTIARLSAMGASAVIHAVASAERVSPQREDVQLSAELRAYLSGLRRCWLEAERGDEIGGVVAYVMIENNEQQALFVSALGRYGRHGQVPLRQQQVVHIVQLPPGWSFLLNGDDRLPNWVRAEPALLVAFLAGLLDGAGQVMLRPTPQIKIELGQRALLRQLSLDLAQWRLALSAPQLDKPAPAERWSLRIGGTGLARLLAELLPHVRHPARHADLIKVVQGDK